MKTGYTCNYLDQDDFDKGIEWCLKQNFNRKTIIDLAEEKFSFSAVGSQYKKFLEKINFY